MKPKHLLAHMLAIVAIVVGTTACGTRSVKGSAASSKNDTLPIYHIGDSLFALQYYDYNFDSCRAYFDAKYSEPSYGGCSQVRKGDYVGRNLDYSINRNACAIIKMERKLNKEGDTIRYASIGVVGCFSPFTYDVAKDKRLVPNSLYHCLPGRTVDGINEKGVYVGVNVVPIRLDISNDGYFSDEACDTDHAYNALYLTRFILDSAKSVDHAIELIRSHTWYFPKKYPDTAHEYQPFHWMIADKNTNCIFEMENGHFVKIFADKLNSASCGTIMTNFSNNLWKDRKIDSLGIGYERWDSLHANYDNVKDGQDMFNLMKSVWFSNSYVLPCTLSDHDKFWFTELSDSLHHADRLYHKGDSIFNLQDSAIIKSITYYRDLFKQSGNWYTDTTHIWFTVHTSLYHLDNLSLCVVPHEYTREILPKSHFYPYSRYHFDIYTKFPLWKEDDTKE